MKAKKILKTFRPDVVVGVGGYASGPVLQVASRKGIPTLIQEQNSYPGITNKLLARKVDKICVAYEGLERYFPKEKIILTGNPVRQDVVHLEGKKEKALKHFGLSAHKKILLVIGGSLGARTINESIKNSLEIFKDNAIQVIWQTGKHYFEEAEKETKHYERHGIKTMDFITKMDYAYAAADLVVSRAGAITVSELCLAGKAAILVPSPNVAEDHQTKNAMALSGHNAAVLIKDFEAREKLGQKALELINNNDAREKLSRNIAGLAHRNSAAIIADEVLNMIN